jgi:ATP-dependent Clp protease adaptor protein ClpS
VLGYPPGVADEPKKPPAEPPKAPEREREGGLATRERPKVERPKRFKVILYNDDYTPMEFVVTLLETVFGKSPSEATQLMLQIHKGGMGVAGVYVLEIAETKVVAVHRKAEERGYPLRAGVEPE